MTRPPRELAIFAPLVSRLLARGRCTPAPYAALWVAILSLACTSNETGALDLFPPGRIAPGSGGAMAVNTGAAPGTAGAPLDATVPPPGAGGMPIDAALPPPDHSVPPPVGCRSDADCVAEDALRCLTATGRCAECVTAADCTSGSRPVCVTAENRCVECEVDGDCTRTDKPGCLKSAGRCEECSDDEQCPAGTLCSSSEGRCR